MQRLVKSAALLEIEMNLHKQIMNLPLIRVDGGEDHPIEYKFGHRDARHAAAELALTADAEIERLRTALCEIANADMTTKGFQMLAREALAGSPVEFGAA